MSTLSEARSSKVEWDGRCILHHRSDLLSLATAVTRGSPLLVPWDATLVMVKGRVKTTPDADNNAVTLYGQEAAAAYATLDVDIANAAGSDMNFTIDVADVPAGEVLYWTTDGDSTTNGDIECIAILVPRQ